MKKSILVYVLDSTQPLDIIRVPHDDSARRCICDSDSSSFLLPVALRRDECIRDEGVGVTANFAREEGRSHAAETQHREVPHVSNTENVTTSLRRLSPTCVYGDRFGGESAPRRAHLGVVAPCGEAVFG